MDGPNPRQLNLEFFYSLITLKNQRWGLLLLLAVSLFLSVWVAIRFRNLVFLSLPLAFILLLQLLHNFRVLFYLLFFAIPFSVQLELGSLSLDMPDEPLMILFSGISMLLLLSGKLLKKEDPIYPAYIWVIGLVVWMIFTTITSTHFFRSGKFLLAKLWYVFCFVTMANYLLKDRTHLVKTYWSFILGCLVVTVVIMMRHAAVGFSFEDSHGIVRPFFPNAVVYGAFLALVLPIAWILRTRYELKSFEWWTLVIASGIILLGIALSFRRGAWVAIALLPIVYFLLQVKLFRWVSIGVLVGTGLLIFYLVQGNTFYYYAPNYEKTVFHEGDISGHLSATLEGKELSGMERLYRWVAAKNMIGENLWLGTGPSTFNQEYKKYTDDAFRTYVSDNPEQSTTHNYFLMTFAEQGLVGGILFLGICMYMVFRAIHVYHRAEDPQLKALVLATLLSLITVLFHSVLNELIEVDKVGPFFWLSLVAIHKLDRWTLNPKEEQRAIV